MQLSLKSTKYGPALVIDLPNGKQLDFSQGFEFNITKELQHHQLVHANKYYRNHLDDLQIAETVIVTPIMSAKDTFAVYVTFINSDDMVSYTLLHHLEDYFYILDLLTEFNIKYSKTDAFKEINRPIYHYTGITSYHPTEQDLQNIKSINLES